MHSVKYHQIMKKYEDVSNLYLNLKDLYPDIPKHRIPVKAKIDGVITDEEYLFLKTYLV